jgi:hypothetical protein
MRVTLSNDGIIATIADSGDNRPALEADIRSMQSAAEQQQPLISRLGVLLAQGLFMVMTVFYMQGRLCFPGESAFVVI